MLEITNLLDPGQQPLFIGYIDPGTGSLLVQFMIAGLLGASYYFRNIFLRLYKKICALFKRKPDNE